MLTLVKAFPKSMVVYGLTPEVCALSLARSAGFLFDDARPATPDELAEMAGNGSTGIDAILDASLAVFGDKIHVAVSVERNPIPNFSDVWCVYAPSDSGIWNQINATVRRAMAAADAESEEDGQHAN